MIGRRCFLSAWLAGALIVALVVGLPGSARADEFSDGAKKFIEALTEEAISTLTGKDVSRSDRSDRFRALMLKTIAVKGIAKFVLGRHWRRTTEGEKKEYLQLFEDLLVVTYADRFEKYSGEKLVVKEAEIRGMRDALVRTTMVRIDGSKALKVDWRVRRKDGKYKIVDIMVEGISMIMAQKSEFASFIKRNGGKIDALLDELRKRIQLNT